MARNLSANYKKNIVSVTQKEPFIDLLHLYHQPSNTNIYITNDKKDVLSNGQNYVACGFVLKLPNDSSNSLPKATLNIQNIGKPIIRYIHDTNGAFGTQARLMSILRSDPDNIEYDVFLDLSSVSINSKTISFDLSFDDVLNRKSVPFTYREKLAPGLF